MSNIDYRKIPLNTYPSPIDDRDYTIAKLTSSPLSTEFPKEFILNYNHEIKHQGDIDSCIGHSLTYAREITQEIQHGVYKKFSVGFVYGNRSDDDYQGTGWCFSEVLKHLRKEGICQFDQFPYNDEYPEVKYKLIQNYNDLLKDAYPNRISAYARIYDLDEIKNTLILLKSPVVFVMKITSQFYKVTKSNPIFQPSNVSEKLEGYHAMTIIGYRVINNQEVLVVLNSWGKEFADNGVFYIPSEVIKTHSKYFVEFWALTDEIVPGGEKMELRTTPFKYITLHHTAGNEENTQRVREIHLGFGWSDIGYNSVIEKNGIVGKGRDPKYVGAHNKGLAPDGSGRTMNEVAYSICHIGNFEEEWMKDVQFNSSVKHCVEVCKKYNIVPSRETIRKHGDDFITACPGNHFPYDKYLNEVIKLYNEGGGNKKVDKGILIFSQDDLSAAKRLQGKVGNCAIFFRNADGTAPSDVKHVNQLFVVGGSGSVGHNNEVLLQGKDWFKTIEAVANYMSK